MAKRYELPVAVWVLVADIFSESRRNRRPRTDDRSMLNGVLWGLCAGADWRDMPKCFGPRSTVYQRFRDWRNHGAFDQMLKRPHVRLNEQGLINLETWMTPLHSRSGNPSLIRHRKKGGLKNRKTMHSGTVGAD